MDGSGLDVLRMHHPLDGSEAARRRGMDDRALEVVSSVAIVYRVSLYSLLGRRRWQPLAEARQVAMFLLSLERGVTATGKTLDRDHTTVAHAVRRVEEISRYDVTMRARVLAASRMCTKGDGYGSRCEDQRVPSRC